MSKNEKSKHPKTASFDDVPTRFKTPAAAGDGFLPLLDRIKADLPDKMVSAVESEVHGESVVVRACLPEGVAVIENCAMSIECPKRWDSLTVTEKPNVRHCDACSREVTFCNDLAKLEQMTEAGACVAFYTIRNGVSRVLTGSVARKPGKPRRSDELRAFIDSL